MIVILCVFLMLLPKPLIAFFRVSFKKKVNQNLLLFEDDHFNPNLLWHEENNGKKELYEIELHDRVNRKYIFICFFYELK